MNVQIKAPDRAPGIFLSLLPVILLLAMFSVSIYTFGSYCSGGPNQIILLAGTALVIFIGMICGRSYRDLEKAMAQGISSFIPAIIILLLIGSLIGIWFLCGTVPTLVYYGTRIISPLFFYPSVAVICAVTSSCIGSSWNTGATVGVACMGICVTLGMDPAVTAGAVISGSYFGDKMSPLSETTNLASSSAEVSLFKHIHNMLYTTIPSIIIAVLIYAVIGFVSYSDNGVTVNTEFAGKIGELFNTNPLTILPLVILFYCTRKKYPTLITLFAGILSGIVIALIFQGPTVAAVFSGDESVLNTLKSLWKVSYGGLELHTENETINSLFSGGGMNGMLNVIFIIIAAMSFGSVMECTGCLNTLINLFIRNTLSSARLVISTLFTCLGVVLISGEQTMGIILPGRMFAPVYIRHKLDASVLTRTLEDGATITSVLIPWTTCGVFFTSVLGISTLDYLPYCFFNLINPVVAVIYALCGIKIIKLDPEEAS